MAAAVVVAHNRVFRRRLREALKQEREIVASLDVVRRMFGAAWQPAGAVVVVPAGTPVHDIEAAVRASLATHLGVEQG